MPRKSNDIGRIYVADLAAYNAGYSKGEWITPSGDVDILAEQIQNILKKHKRKGEPVGEEWGIFDYDGFPDMGEFPGLEELAAMADALETCDNPEALRVLMAAEKYYAEDVEAALSFVRDNFIGVYANASRELVDEWLDEGIISEEQIENHFDAESYGRDVRFDLDEEEDAWAADLSDQELGEHYFDELGPEGLGKKTLRQYFDAEGFYRDLELGGDITVYHHGSKDYVFHSA